MKRLIPAAAIGLIFLLGCAFVVYPLVSNSLYEKNQSAVLAEYDDTVAQMEAKALSRELEDARNYNRLLTSGTAVLTDPFDPTLSLDPTVEPYASLLNLAGDGMMGYLEIPSIQVYLPIYHGTGSQVLEQGVGHLQNTSLPVGGEGTHTVLTGHTGLAGKRLFTDLSQVKEGEAFFLHVLGETLAYRVQETAVVEPEDTSRLVVEKGKDLATLLTCYPYGINSHRLLVFGERTPFEEADVQGERPDGQGKAERSLWQQEYRRAVVLCLGIYIPLTLSVIWVVLHRRKKVPTQAWENVGWNNLAGQAVNLKKAKQKRTAANCNSPFCASDKILPHGGEKIHHHARFQADAAVFHPVLFQQGVSGTHLPHLIPHSEAKPSRHNVGHLGVGVMVHGSHCPSLEHVFHTHGLRPVGKHPADHSFSRGLGEGFPVGNKYLVFVLDFHFYHPFLRRGKGHWFSSAIVCAEKCPSRELLPQGGSPPLRSRELFSNPVYRLEGRKSKRMGEKPSICPTAQRGKRSFGKERKSCAKYRLFCVFVAFLG